MKLLTPANLLCIALLVVAPTLVGMQEEDRRLNDKAQDNPLWHRALTPTPSSPQRYPSPLMRPPLPRTDSCSPSRTASPSRLCAALCEARRNSISISAEIAKEPAIKKQPTKSDSPRIAVLKLRTSNNKLSPRSAEELAAIFDVPCDAKRAIESIEFEALGLEINMEIKQNTRMGKGIILDGIEKIAKEKEERIDCAQKIIAARKIKIAAARGKLKRTNTIG